MREIDDQISLFVKDQFPAFYAEEGETFRVFLEAYYEWMEQSGNTVDVARNQIEYRDIDKTTSQFLDEFKKTYLKDLPGLIKSDDRLTIKNIFDFYKSKGSQRAIQLLFRIVFNDSATVFYPSEDVIRPSDASYRRPRYIECYAPDVAILKSLEGIEITGATSGAKAFVESISTKLLNNVRTNVLRLSNLRGNFLRGEVLSKSSDGIQDNMPIVTGSLSDINITLGGSNNAVGDIFNITGAQGKQGLARVTSIADATGLVSFNLANGGFGFSTNTGFTAIDINDQNVVVANVVNEAQTYSNTVESAYDYVGKRIDNAQFIRFETVDQTLEEITILSGVAFNSNIQSFIANTENETTSPWITGRDSGNTVIANGYVVNLNVTDTGESAVLIAPITGSFGNQNELTITLADSTHTFQVRERIDEEDQVELEYASNTGAFTAGDIIQGDESNANGVVESVNATHITVNGSFGTWVANDNVYIVSANSTTANVTGINVTTQGANAEVSSANSTVLNVADIVGEFTQNKKVKGQRTNAIATIDAGGVAVTGVSDVFFNNINGTQAVVDTYANATVTAEVIGSNATNVGFRNTRYPANNSVATFVANTSAHIVGRDSNTFANIVTVGTGSGATFKIGSLENEDAITIYTDFIGDNNSANVAYLDCVIDGGNSGIGFLDSIDITDGGNNYEPGQTIVFDRGGPGGGPPNINAVATITTVTTNATHTNTVTSITVTNPGDGFFTSSPANTDNLSVGTGLTFDTNFDFGYGFPKDSDGDYTSILDTVLTRYSGNIGTISSLTEINPGNNYNFDPFLSVYSGGIAKFDKRDVILYLEDKTGTFIVGENVNQTVTNPGQTLTISTITGSYSNGDPYAATIDDFTIGSSVQQVINSTANAIGDIFQSDTNTISIVNPRIKIFNAAANVFTYDAANLIPFVSSASNLVFSASPNTEINVASVSAQITAVGQVVQSAVSKGQVYAQGDDPQQVRLRRLSFAVGFNDSGPVTGSLSGATGTVIGIQADEDTRPIGDNADINATAQAANGIVTSVEVIDSGYGYQHDSTVTLVSTNTAQNIVVSGTANVTTTGLGQGFWADKTSFLNNKYIHDNNFYQSYSYLIESGLSLDKYRDIVLKSAHVAGTRLFGRVIKQSTVNNEVTIANSSIEAI